MSDELKQAILDFMKKSAEKGKKKLYAKDIAKGVSDKFESREAKKMVQQMLNANELAYWSSGSTTYVMLPEEYAKVAEQEEQ